MNTTAKTCTFTVIPALRYVDAPAAIEWLCNALGFEKRSVFLSDDKTVQHAELTFGNGMIMIGSVTNGTPYSAMIKQPRDVGAETQSPYLIVADCKALYERAIAAGAEIVFELREMSYGGNAFTCRDPEGHTWSIGEYDPWEQKPAGEVRGK